MVADLMSAREDPLDGRRIAIRGPAGDEERRPQVVFAQQVEDARHADERAIGLVGHHTCIARVQAALREDRRLGVDVERQAGVDHRTALRERSSYMTFAAASAVMLPALSYGGETSTTSQPTRSIPRSERSKASASAVENPPTSGVPVPGAKAGSRKSMSNDRKTGLPCVLSRTSAPYSCDPVSLSSSVVSTVKPSSRASSMTAAA